MSSHLKTFFVLYLQFTGKRRAARWRKRVEPGLALVSAAINNAIDAPQDLLRKGNVLYGRCHCFLCEMVDSLTQCKVVPSACVCTCILQVEHTRVMANATTLSDVTV